MAHARTTGNGPLATSSAGRDERGVTFRSSYSERPIEMRVER
jgi:hypothetical protein